MSEYNVAPWLEPQKEKTPMEKTKRMNHISREVTDKFLVEKWQNSEDCIR